MKHCLRTTLFMLALLAAHVSVSAQSVGSGQMPSPPSNAQALTPDQAKAYFLSVQAWAKANPAGVSQLDARQQEMLKNDDYTHFAAYTESHPTSAQARPAENRVQQSDAVNQTAAPSAQTPESALQAAKEKQSREQMAEQDRRNRELENANQPK